MVCDVPPPAAGFGRPVDPLDIFMERAAACALARFLRGDARGSPVRLIADNDQRRESLIALSVQIVAPSHLKEKQS